MGRERDRIEIPHTFNHWEAAYVSPDFSLARGWLRQLDRERNKLFYDGREPTHARYRQWLHDNGIRWVAASDARLDYSAVDEDRLVRERPAVPAPAGAARALATCTRWSAARGLVRPPTGPRPC